MSEPTHNPEAELWRGRTWVLLTYVLAAITALFMLRVVSPLDGFTASLWAHLTATLVVFAASWWFDNTSVYDPYWSVVPTAVILSWAAFLDLPGDPARAGAVAVVVLAWGTRLTGNWARGWPGLHHEDWRYQRFRSGGPIRYWSISLFGLHGFPSALVAVGSWGAWLALATPGHPFRWVDLVALGLGMASVALEHVADEQARAFRQTRDHPEAVLRTGVWAWSRHPNYLGEIGFWTSLAVFAMGATWTNVVALVGPFGMIALFRFVSIPMMERRQLARKPDYASYLAEVPMLFPRRPAPPKPPPPPQDPTTAPINPAPRSPSAFGEGPADPTILADDDPTPGSGPPA